MELLDPSPVVELLDPEELFSSPVEVELEEPLVEPVSPALVLPMDPSSSTSPVLLLPPEEATMPVVFSGSAWSTGSGEQEGRTRARTRRLRGMAQVYREGPSFTRLGPAEADSGDAVHLTARGWLCRPRELPEISPPFFLELGPELSKSDT